MSCPPFAKIIFIVAEQGKVSKGCYQSSLLPPGAASSGCGIETNKLTGDKKTSCYCSDKSGCNSAVSISLRPFSVFVFLCLSLMVRRIMWGMLYFYCIYYVSYPHMSLNTWAWKYILRQFDFQIENVIFFQDFEKPLVLTGSGITKNLYFQSQSYSFMSVVFFFVRNQIISPWSWQLHYHYVVLLHSSGVIITRLSLLWAVNCIIWTIRTKPYRFCSFQIVVSWAFFLNWLEYKAWLFLPHSFRLI